MTTVLARAAAAEPVPAPVPRVGVLVVEAEALTRSALADVINAHPQLAVVATAGSVEAALEALAAGGARVIVCGLFLPDGDACSLFEQLSLLSDRPDMVVLTQFATAAAAAVCRAIGIRTCLSRDARPEHVVDAILAAADHKPWTGPGAVAPAAHPPLSFLQTQILAQVASGESNDAIARRLGYSVNYVKDLIASARGQLDARDRAHAASLAVALRLVRPVGEGRFVPALPSLEQLQATADRRRGTVTALG